MREENYKQFIEEISQRKFADFDAVTFDKGGLCVTVSGKDFQKLRNKDANSPQNERVVDNFSK